MKRTVLVAAIGVIALASLEYYWRNPSPDAALRARWAMLDRYCAGCHNNDDSSGDVSFEGLTPDAVHTDIAVLEAALRKLRVGLMPPRGEPQPDPQLRDEFIGALETALDRAAENRPYAGAVPVHRLNRAEYANAIRDLLAVEVDVSELPSDGGDFGFDNIAEVLTTSPTLLERYLSVALKAADLAIGDRDAVPTTHSYKIDVEVSQDKHMEGLPLGTRGGRLVRHTFPADGEYILSGRLLRTVAEGYVGVEGHDIPHEFLILLDGVQVFSVTIGGQEDHDLSSKSILESKIAIDEKMTSKPIPITAGPHELTFTWKERPEAEQNVWQPALRASVEAHNPAGMPRLETAIIEGPYRVTGISDTPSRDRIFVCRPASAAEEAPCAERIIWTLARRAFRRPVDADDLASPLALYNEARRDGRDFERGIHDAIAQVLVNPWFLYRTELESAEVPVGGVHPVSDVELASRLSFFLWSSIPDEELLGLAIAGRLRDPAILEKQVRRMVADERADALITNFTGQWLQLRNLDRVVPAILMFPDFDDNLRQAFRRETELLFENVLREDRSVLELLDADYTFVNERLARHYGIRGIYGTRFRRVAVTDPNRRGLLGHASILSLTSAASRTSPVMRGKYVLANFMNSPPPPPLPLVPALEDAAPTDRPSTVREQLERHRADAACAGCHNMMDPIGLALENFDAIGQWHDTTREGLAIDAAGILADGTPVNGPVELREALLSRPEVFAGTVTEKLMVYALGRGLDPADMPRVRSILRNAAKQDYRLLSIILGIVESEPFQMRTRLGRPDALSIAQTKE
jgi:hypothetical protein